MSFYNRLKKRNVSEPFFKALKTKLQVAQNRLKSDMMACNDLRQKPGIWFVLYLQIYFCYKPICFITDTTSGNITKRMDM